jgi:transposase
VTGYDGFKKITGTKIHVAVDCNGLPISIVISSANQHDSTKFIDVIESISDFLDDDMIDEIASVYADKGYDAVTIREYLKNRNIISCIPKRNFKTEKGNTINQNNYNKTRFVVERFFAWLKNGFHRTRIRYERIAENYLAFVNIACIMMYWRVLG